jgi:hypothetical protein
MTTGTTAKPGPAPAFRPSMTRALDTKQTRGRPGLLKAKGSGGEIGHIKWKISRSKKY